jgi:cobyrinic acid a,c-diamide synthase
MTGLIIAAPSSGQGKTVVTLGLLRALRRRGHAVRAAKSGPDHIDPRFHEAATGVPCPNLDAWAMTPERIASLAAGDGLLVVEGAMGLFDAAPNGRGATADIARLLRLPVILVVDASRMAHSIGALVQGFDRHDPAVRVAGVILNRTGSEKHRRLLTEAVERVGLRVLGSLPRTEALAHPSRHLGLVQASEREGLERFLDGAASAVEASVDLDALLALASGPGPAPKVAARPLPPPAQVIAVACDAAFSFAYPHLLADWRSQGAEVRPFSPLADEAVPEAGFVFLPGGYPELHAGRLAAAGRFLGSLRRAAETTHVYGECGGYMVLGEALVDGAGHAHRMAGLLRLATSFEVRRLHLGYRTVAPSDGAPQRWTAHEFHYATTILAEGKAAFDAWDAQGDELGPYGLCTGQVSGSFLHIIDQAP